MRFISKWPRSCYSVYDFQLKKKVFIRWNHSFQFYGTDTMGPVSSVRKSHYWFTLNFFLLFNFFY
jgi:hypothetical protein